MKKSITAILDNLAGTRVVLSLAMAEVDSRDDTNVSIKWHLCIFCQSNTSEHLECPAKSKASDSGKGYTTLVDCLKEFRNAEALPITIDLVIMDVETLKRHEASWHKSCRVQYNRTKLQRVLKRKVKSSTSGNDSGLSDVKITRSASNPSASFSVFSDKLCFFCDKSISSSDRYKRVASTFDLDRKVRKCATDLCDSRLLTKLAGGDMVATEAEYHANCLTSLYKQHAQFLEQSHESNSDGNIHGIVFAELLAYIDEARCDEERPSFRLANLVQLYNNRLGELGVKDSVHATRLKDKILSQIPDLSAHTSKCSQGQGVIFMFNSDVANLVQEANRHRDYDLDAIHIAKAAEIVRLDMFDNVSLFNGSFPPQCQEHVIPKSLKALVDMVLQGPSIKDQSAKEGSDQAALTISQMFLFNAVKHSRHASTSGQVRHKADRETPLPLYIGLKLHAATRKKRLVDMMFQLGMSVCYDRVLQVITDLANGTCDRFEAEGVVCPVNMKLGLFTVGALDNCDHNPTSATAHDSFHGTSISLFQFPTEAVPGTDRGITLLHPASPHDDKRKVVPLPDAYADVPPAILRTKTMCIPVAIVGPVTPAETSVQEAMLEEQEWLVQVRRLVDKTKLEKGDYVSWAAYHASRQSQEPHPVTLGSLLPLFYESAHTVAMVKHGMDVIRNATHYVNPGQIAVMAVDQPLYSLAKQIQMSWPVTHGEDKYLIMFGGLHIEMAAFRALGTWLQDSGWTSALVQADVTTPGTADSFIKVAHVTKTRHAHQVTAASLAILKHKAYQAYIDSLPEEDPKVEIGDWEEQRVVACPHFQYWWLTLKLQLMVLLFVRAERDGNFCLYVETLNKLTPWFFALDQTNYARWLPVHIRDLNTLSQVHPDLHTEFQNGNFVIHKTARVSSGMAIDQGHEQNNAMVKGSGGAVGLTENPSAFRRWMVAGPELARITIDFETAFTAQDDDTGHHEQTPAVQTAFAKQVMSLVSTIEDMGNPFLEESADLLVLDTKDIVSESVVKTVRNIEQIGVKAYDAYVEQRLVKAEKPISDPIAKQQLPLFSRPQKKNPSRSQLQVADLEVDRELMSQLYVSCQTRAVNQDDFFMYENHPYAPSLSDHGKLRASNKSDLIPCLQSLITPKTDGPTVDCIILDGAAVVHLLAPRTAATFNEYASAIFLPYIDRQLQNAQRVDVVWDAYIPDSLKESTRKKRGTGIRRRVLGTSKIPTNWMKFLCVAENKVELFDFLTHAVINRQQTEHEVYATDGVDVLCSQPNADCAYISPCNHEEADTRVILHASDAANKGSKKCLIRTVDTDILVLAIAYVERIGVEELWVAFGTGKGFCYLPAHEIACALGSPKAASLPMFHAFTGCDTVSAFAGKGKKTMWAVWRVYPEITEAFVDLCSGTDVISTEATSLIERFVILVYDRTSQLKDVNEVRKDLFTRKGRFKYDSLPPTKAALTEHAKRATYQGGHVWGQSIRSQMKLPDPAAWGWTKTNDGWEPYWTPLPEASKGCRELIKCGCKKVCTTGRCGCFRAKLSCTTLCSCMCMDSA